MGVIKSNYSISVSKQWLIYDTGASVAAAAAAAKKASDGSLTAGALGASIQHPPPINNPLQASGALSNCCQNPIVTVWLTDKDGDPTYATATLTGGSAGPPATPPTGWSVNFTQMPSGNYTLTVQIQCGNQVASQSMNITL